MGYIEAGPTCNSTQEEDWRRARLEERDRRYRRLGANPPVDPRRLPRKQGSVSLLNAGSSIGHRRQICQHHITSNDGVAKDDHMCTLGEDGCKVAVEVAKLCRASQELVEGAHVRLQSCMVRGCKLAYMAQRGGKVGHPRGGTLEARGVIILLVPAEWHPADVLCDRPCGVKSSPHHKLCIRLSKLGDVWGHAQTNCGRQIRG